MPKAYRLGAEQDRVQGTPLTKFGSGDQSIEFARKRLVQKLIAEAAVAPNSDVADACERAAGDRVTAIARAVPPSRPGLEWRDPDDDELANTLQRLRNP